jgi:hypothetical protein
MSVSLRTLATLAGTVESTEPLVVSFGDADLARRAAALGANEVHLVFLIGSRLGPPDGAVLVHVNGALVGSVAFFAHNGHIGHGETPFRLPLRPPPAAGGVTATFTSVPYPGRTLTRPALDVVASLELVMSIVD